MLGPATATNTLAQDFLPTNLVFASASGGGVFSSNIVTWPVFPSLTNGQATNLILTVTPLAGISTSNSTANPFNFIETNTTPTVGFLTNSASAFAATFDPNLTNNSASTAYTNAQVQTVIVPGVFSIFIATNTYPTNGFQGLHHQHHHSHRQQLLIHPSAPARGILKHSFTRKNVSVTNIGTALRPAPADLCRPPQQRRDAFYSATGSTNIASMWRHTIRSRRCQNNPPDNFVIVQLEFFRGGRASVHEFG